MQTVESIGPTQLSFERLNYAEPYVPGSMSDGRKLGLAVGSGGAAGPISLGALVTLLDLGVFESLDAVYGVSVGGFNVAAAVARQIETALKGYNTMTESDFIKWLRVYKIMDLGILKRVIMHDAHGLDIDAIADSPIPINIGVTRLSGGIQPVSFDLTKIGKDSIVDVLLWGASVPGATGLSPRDRKNIGEGRNTAYADGGFSILSAVDMAKSDDCTDIIYLPNQKYEADERQNWQVALFGSLMSPYDKRALFKFSNIVDAQIKSREVFLDGEFNYQGAMVEAFYPPPAPKLPTFWNKDKEKIVFGFEWTKTHVLNRLTGLYPEWVPLLT